MSENNIDTSIIQSRQIVEMLTVANEFCLFAEEIEKFDKSYITEYLQRVLPLLYIKGSLLPEVDETTDSDYERYVIEETWEYLFNYIRQLFGNENSYYFWNPELNEAAESSVAETMADLYQDLKDFVFLYSKPAYYAKLNSVHMCRNLFIHRWGKQIPGLMNHLHRMLYGHEEETEQYEDE
jgi:hypothetical protein